MTEKKPAPQKPPAGLSAAGSALWRSVVAVWDLDARERSILGSACRQADAVAALDALVKADGLTVTGSTGQTRLHPAIAEARQGRLAVERLLGALDLPGEEPAKDGASTVRSLRARKAAEARWRFEASKRQVRRGATA